MTEKVLVFVKPDGLKRKLVGKIISRFENKDLRIVAMKVVKASKKLAEKQYPKTEKQIVGMGKKTLEAAIRGTGSTKEVERIFGTRDPRRIGLTLREWMIEFLLSSPVIAMVLEGKNAVERARMVSGYTDPSKAEKGTIRGDFCADSILKANRERRATENLVHVSGDKAEAEREVKLWFKQEELFK